MTAATPRLSVIIASYNAEATIASCLSSLEHQTTDEPFEVIVVDSSTDATPRIVAQGFPWIHLHTFPERKYCGDARNFGVSVAGAEIVAFLDADCTADSRWVEEIVKAHSDPALAIGGSIANGNPESFIGWAAYFCEFSAWMPGGTPRWVNDIAGANMSYKREVFERYGCFIGGTYCSDTELHWRLDRAGHRLLFKPSIRVFHKNISTFIRFLRHEFQHGRFFARVRVRYGNFSFIRRTVYIFLFVFISAKLFLRIYEYNMKNRIYFFDFSRSAVLVALGLIFWTIGEVSGYIRAYE
jgi:glycosyltransferase involved in cell wall biosynthesis